MIIIETPANYILQFGDSTVRLEWNSNFGSKMSGSLNKVQSYIDITVLRYCDPYVPFDTGSMKRSGIMGTVIGSGEIKYIAPYARNQYYNNAGQGKQGIARGGLRGSYFFERMKAQRGVEIYNGARKVAGLK